MALAIIILFLDIILFAAVAFAGYDILWPVRRPTAHEKRLYLEQDALIDKRVESNPPLNLARYFYGYDGSRDVTSKKMIEFLKTIIERNKNDKA